MVKLIAIVGDSTQTFYKPSTASIHAKHFADKAEIELVEIKDILSLINQLTNSSA